MKPVWNWRTAPAAVASGFGLARQPWVAAGQRVRRGCVLWICLGVLALSTTASLAQTPPASGAGREGFELLLAAARKAPSAVSPEDLAAPKEDAAQALALCREAVSAGIHVPAGLDGPALAAQLRPLLRLLRTRATLAREKRDPAAAIEACSQLLQIARAFVAKVGPSCRQAGFVVDGYGIAALNEASAVADAHGCNVLIRDVEQYLGAWAPAEQVFQSGEGKAILEKAPAVAGMPPPVGRLTLQMNVYRAAYRMAAIKLALRREFLASGRYPKTIEGLDVSHRDPLAPGGQSFRYRLKSEGYLLYSVGPDGTDDGGRAKTIPQLLAGQRGDLVFEAER